MLDLSRKGLCPLLRAVGASSIFLFQDPATTSLGTCQSLTEHVRDSGAWPLVPDKGLQRSSLAAL